VIGASILPMRSLPCLLVVVAACLAPRDTAAAFPDVERLPTTPSLGVLEQPRLEIWATEVTGDTTASRSQPSPSRQSPVVRRQAKLSFRVVDVPVLSGGDVALLARLACPNEVLPRLECALAGLRGVGRCVLLCRFLL
jgi:hypothetical protein